MYQFKIIAAEGKTFIGVYEDETDLYYFYDCQSFDPNEVIQVFRRSFHDFAQLDLIKGDEEYRMLPAVYWSNELIEQYKNSYEEVTKSMTWTEMQEELAGDPAYHELSIQDIWEAFGMVETICTRGMKSNSITEDDGVITLKVVFDQ